MVAKPGRTEIESEEVRRRARKKARAYRERMRAKGLRPVQLWLPDTRTKAFAQKAREESAAISRSEMAADDQAFVDAVSELTFE